MTKPLTVRDIAMISLCAALTIATNLVFYQVFFFLFMLNLCLLGRQKSLIYALLVATINFMAGMGVITALNIVLLPLTALILHGLLGKIFGGELPKQPSLGPKVLFALGSGVVILASNLFYNVVYWQLFGLSPAYLWQTFPMSLLVAVVNPLLFAFIGYRLVARLPQLKGERA